MNKDFIMNLCKVAYETIKQEFEAIINDDSLRERIYDEAKAGSTKIWICSLSSFRCDEYSMKEYLSTLDSLGGYGRYCVECDNESAGIYLVLDIVKWNSKINSNKSAILRVFEEELAKWPEGKKFIIKSTTVNRLEEDVAKWLKEKELEDELAKCPKEKELEEELAKWPEEKRLSSKSGMVQVLEEELAKWPKETELEKELEEELSKWPEEKEIEKEVEKELSKLPKEKELEKELEDELSKWPKEKELTKRPVGRIGYLAYPLL